MFFNKPKVPKSNEERRLENNKFIKKLGITCNENLPVLEPNLQEKLKDIDTICRRAIASLLAIQLACDISNDSNYEESKKFFLDLAIKFGVENNFLDKEKRLFDNTYSKQDVIDVAWSYEDYWSLVWALGLIKDIKKPFTTCDCEKGILLVCACEKYEDFKNKCKLRNVEEIEDMLDLYYRYHWSCVEKSLHPNTIIGSLNSEVVMERRRGLEWLFSDETDWNNISLDT